MTRTAVGLWVLAVALSAACGGACGGSSGAAKDAASQPTGDGGPSETASTGAALITGTLTLPTATTDKVWGVQVLTGVGATPVAQSSGLTAGETMLAYSVPDVPAGTYYLLAFVDVDGSGLTGSTPGDLRGWYGHTGDGNPPAALNVVVPASGTLTFDWALVVRPP